MIQQHWRRRRQTRERMCPPAAHKGGGGGERGGKRARAGSVPTVVERRALDPDYAATVIQVKKKDLNLNIWNHYVLVISDMKLQSINVLRFIGGK